MAEPRPDELFTYGQNADHDKHMDWLYGDSGLPMCKCAGAWHGLGRLHGINMGKGWVRVTTHPDCAHHGTKAEADRKKRLKSKGFR